MNNVLPTNGKTSAKNTLFIYYQNNLIPDAEETALIFVRYNLKLILLVILLFKRIHLLRITNLLRHAKR